MRVHKITPGRGGIVIFKHRRYDQVREVCVNDMVSEKTWKKRYDHINEFERLMANEGTTILKFFLHIDKDEQKERLQARLDEPDKHWKFSLGDLEGRKLWNQYMAAYEDVLNKTSTPWAPWYVIPANRKWYRDLVISTILVNTLKKLDMKYPEPKDDLSNVVIE